MPYGSVFFLSLVFGHGDRSNVVYLDLLFCNVFTELFIHTTFVFHSKHIACKTEACKFFISAKKKELVRAQRWPSN